MENNDLKFVGKTKITNLAKKDEKSILDYLLDFLLGPSSMP
jgi:hypothetical protein